jgi:hypothetical protein
MASPIPNLTFNNTEFKACDPTLPGPVDCVLSKTTGERKFSKIIARQSVPPAAATPLNLSYMHTPWSGYFNVEQAALCGSSSRAGIDNTCWGTGNVPISPSDLSAPFSSNPGPYNLNNGKYLFELTQPVAPLTANVVSADVIIKD